MTGRHISRIAALLGLLLACTGPAAAAERAVLADGRSLVCIERTRVPGGWEITLAEGGKIVLPAAQVTRFEVLASHAPDGPAVAGSPEAASEDGAPAGGVADRDGAVDTIVEMIGRVAAEYSIDPKLVEAVIQVESGFDPFAVSPKGAAGLMQLMPETASRFSVSDVFDPLDNLRGGVRYLRWLNDRFKGDLGLVLAAYNAGEGAVDRHMGVPPYRETRLYVVKVLERYLQRPQAM